VLRTPSAAVITPSLMEPAASTGGPSCAMRALSQEVLWQDDVAPAGTQQRARCYRGLPPTDGGRGAAEVAPNPIESI
jgi:hypothetical protein